MTPSPFVLVHGGGHGAWCWEAVLPKLPSGSIAVDLPGRGTRSAATGPMTLQRFADAVIEDVIRARLETFTLVGHSMAGLILPAIAAALSDQVTRLVFISAILPHENETMLQALYPHWQARLVAAASAFAGDRRTGPRWLLRRRYCNDMPRERHGAVLDRVCAEWLSVTVEPVAVAPSALRVPMTYVELLRDRALPLPRQREFASRLGSGRQVVSLDAGHDVMLSRPNLVTELLLHEPRRRQSVEDPYGRRAQ